MKIKLTIGLSDELIEFLQRFLEPEAQPSKTEAIKNLAKAFPVIPDPEPMPWVAEVSHDPLSPVDVEQIKEHIMTAPDQMRKPPARSRSRKPATPMAVVQEEPEEEVIPQETLDINKVREAARIKSQEGHGLAVRALIVKFGFPNITVMDPALYRPFFDEVQAIKG